MSTQVQVDIRANYEHILERMERAARDSGRRGDAVRLVVVTKKQPVETIRAAVEAGARWLGENYAEEALPKILALSAEKGVEWHMIGHVQSRKAGLIGQHFDWVHSLDSVKLAERLDRFAGEAGRTLPVLLELNIGEEESKSGWKAADQAQWPALLPEIARILPLAHLKVVGLMTMPPLFPHPEQSRPYFRRLAALRDYLSVQLPGVDLRELSMGTSADFEVAIQEGATIVRVGQAILGPRP